MLAWAVDGEERRPALFIVDKDLPGVEMTDDPDFTHNFPYRHPEYTFTDDAGAGRRACSARWGRGST